LKCLYILEMVCQSYNLSNPHIEDYTVRGYAATIGWLCVTYIFGGASDTLKMETANSSEMLAKY